jgi:integrase
MLMSLVSVTRGHELRALNLRTLITEEDKVTFHITDRTKTGLQKVTFHKYDISENLDVVACIEAYIVATQARRNSEAQKTQLLISFKSPYEPVSTSTIARWLKMLMELAGVDIQTYKAHSTRSASTSKAKERGMTTKQIMQAANWKNANTFLRYYNKNIDKEQRNQSQFSEVVLS